MKNVRFPKGDFLENEIVRAIQCPRLNTSNSDDIVGKVAEFPITIMFLFFLDLQVVSGKSWKQSV